MVQQSALIRFAIRRAPYSRFAADDGERSNASPGRRAQFHSAANDISPNNLSPINHRAAAARQTVGAIDVRGVCPVFLDRRQSLSGVHGSRISQPLSQCHRTPAICRPEHVVRRAGGVSLPVIVTENRVPPLLLASGRDIALWDRIASWRWDLLCPAFLPLRAPPRIDART